MAETTPRVVFDCNIYVQALLNRKGVSGSCKHLVDAGKVILFISKSILSEVIDGINRPKIRNLAPSLTQDQIEDFLEDIKAKAINRYFYYLRLLLNSWLKIAGAIYSRMLNSKIV